MPHYDKGRYLAEVVELGFQVASSGNPMIVLSVKPYAKIEGQGEGETFDEVADIYHRTIRLAVIDKTQDMVLAKLRYAGFQGTDFTELNLIGAVVRCTCNHDEYEGKQVEKWDLALPPRERQPVKNEPNLALKLNALFGKKLQSQDTRPHAETVYSPPGDIPF